ncbi:glycoside hydrolase family 19 protein [Paraburkholderia tropica]|uniref:Predicted chitinase n=1 Tax=Paraburkholderia tropica TaxID=92647 RepID=A0AAQ1JWV6_9BURK|nr:glycoside hydrolase family 19 protein [Paraburkholderia tropica]RQN40799.1 hypothetical protein EHZ25_00620 [Paraburkholderia tropica]SEK09332.1 Predicted chitinase [Paraburkholderia tropica]
MSTQHPAHPSQQPATTAPTASSTSAPAYIPLKWAFPFSPVDSKADATDPMTYMKALAQAEDGFYPLGASGMWHGGVHFDGNSAQMLKQDEGVRAIADGEVVAYRMDSKYPEQAYQDGRHALYSTGFVLVRHKLQLPPVPPKPAASSQPAPDSHAASGAQSAPAAHPAPSTSAAASTNASSKPSPDETLTFFSLYMHLTDWSSYQAAMKQAANSTGDTARLNMEPMPYWEGDRYYRVGDRAKDPQDVPKPKASPALPTGTAASDPLGEFIDAGFIVKKDLPAPQPVDDTPLPPPVKGIRIRATANGKIIGILPTGSELTVSESDQKNPGWWKISALKSGQPVGPEVGKPASEHARWGWVYVKELDPVVDPRPLDTVVVLKTPYPVKAGDVVGEPGHYLRYTDAKILPAKPTRSLLHLEVFAGPELKAFIDKSRARAKDLPAAKTFLEISPGALLVTDIPDPDQTLPQSQGGLKLVPVGNTQGSRWVKVQPKTVTAAAQSSHSAHGAHHAHSPTLTSVGSPVWVEARLANTTTTEVVKGWANFPVSFSRAKGPGADFRDVFRRVDLDRLGAENIAVDDKGHHWWNITIGAKDGSTRQGWVCEDNHPLTRMCGPWDWPGFELVDNSGFKPVDMLKRYIHATDQYLPGEDKSEFEPSAMSVNAGELIVKLEKAIDANHDGKVTAQELKHAQETPWMAEAISHLVARNESEWGGGLGKWEALSPLMKKLLWLWQAEIERIGKLQWWEQAAGIEGFPKEPTPWHFHPVGLVGNFSESDCCAITVDLLEKVLGKSGDWFTGKGGTASFVLHFPEKYPGIYKFDKYRFVSLLNEKMTKYGIITCYQKAHFLAQCFHESARFETTIEFASGEGYNPGVHKDAIKNGNTVMGDGPKYKGKGLIQLTWKNTYKAYSDYRGIDFVSNPDLVASNMENAIDASCWFWRHKGGIQKKYDANGDINVLIDHEKNNVTMVTLAVNGGDNGLKERQALFDRIKKEWGLA